MYSADYVVACCANHMFLGYALGCSAGEGETDDLDNTNKSFQEGAFATLYTLTKNRQLDASFRLAALKIVLEFLQVICSEVLCRLHAYCGKPLAVTVKQNTYEMNMQAAA
jgi:hypothetical protein